MQNSRESQERYFFFQSKNAKLVNLDAGCFLLAKCPFTDRGPLVAYTRQLQVPPLLLSRVCLIPPPTHSTQLYSGKRQNASRGRVRSSHQ